MVKLIVLVSMLAMWVGCGGDPAEDEALAQTTRCEQLRAHFVDLRLASATNLGKDLEQHRAALTQALGAEFISSCTTTMSESQVSCALAAKDLQAATDCSLPQTSN